MAEYYEEEEYYVDEERETVEEVVVDNTNSEMAVNVQDQCEMFHDFSCTDVTNHLWSLTEATEGALTHTFTSCFFKSLVHGLLHKFMHICPKTGSILGAVAGNEIFNYGGKGNKIGEVGKLILDNMLSGNYVRDVDYFVPYFAIDGVEYGLDFNAERERCLQEHYLFEDPEFPASDESLYFANPPNYQVEWLRPGEIVDDPQFIVGGESRFDVKQGGLGDCWFLAALANITVREELFYRVVPPDQSFTENYAGIFHFQFWRYGRWVDVVIDDRLPTYNGRLIYMHSHEYNEFWSALLEKAYAKLYGSYENIESGNSTEAFEDFTGGLTEFFNLQTTDSNLVMAMMVRGFQMGSIFCCSIQSDPNVREAIRQNGLVMGHAYSITALQMVSAGGEDVPLIRVRNPWGNEKEWNGPWSDGSAEWDYVDDETKEMLQFNYAGDGEFWIRFEDFCENFNGLEVCNLSAQIMNEVSEMTGVELDTLGHWDEEQHDGEWSSDYNTAGGCQNYRDTFEYNPQFGTYFTVSDEAAEQDGLCTVIAAVLQKFRREMRTIGESTLPIGFSIYDVGDQEGPLSADFFYSAPPVAKTNPFINSREVTCRFRVYPGQYVIVPSTFEPYCDGHFLLRLYTNGDLQTSKFR